MNVASINNRVFLTAFSQGLIGVGALLILLVIWAWIQGGQLQQELIERMDSETIVVEQPFKETPTEDVKHPHLDTHHTSNDKHGSHEETAEEKHSYENIPLFRPELVESTDYGYLPQPDPTTGLTPFDAYKKEFSIPLGKKPLSIVISPIGLKKEYASEIIRKLPEFITLGVSPYSSDIRYYLSLAKKAEKETWLLLPIETRSPLLDDTGPLSLRADFSSEQNKKNYKTVIGSATGYAGLLTMNAGNTTLSFNSPRIQAIFKDVDKRGLAVAYVAPEEIPGLSAEMKTKRVVHISYESEEPFDSIKTKLDQLLSENRPTVVVLTPHPAQISAISEWIKTLPNKGFVLAPLSVQVK